MSNKFTIGCMGINVVRVHFSNWNSVKGLIMLAFGSALFGCISTHTDKAVRVHSFNDEEMLQSRLRYQKDYTLMAGDLVEISVYQFENFSKEGYIRPDGYLTLPVLDDVRAAGITPRELDLKVTQLLSKRLKNPEVSVFVKNAQEPMIYVHGEVNVASAIPLRFARTVAQALAQAGGTRRTAALSQIAVIRLGNDGFIRAMTLEEAGAGQPDFYLAMQNTSLQSEDIILVPENYRSQFTRWVTDFINTPLGAFNQLLSPYFQFKILKEISD